MQKITFIISLKSKSGLRIERI